MTDLFRLAREGHELSDGLIDLVPDINMTNEDGLSLLHMSVAYANRNFAEQLIGRGIDINAQDHRGQTPLHYAAIYQSDELTRLLLENGCRVDITDKHGNTPLWSAILHSHGNYCIVGLILERGGRQVVDLKNNHGRSPVDFAKENGKEELARMLTG